MLVAMFHVEPGREYHARAMASAPHHCDHIESIARCVIVRERRVLLCGAIGASGAPEYWYLPGGHIEPGETARDAVAREMIEESATRVQVGECVLVAENHFTQIKRKTGDKVRRHEYTLVFVATLPTSDVHSVEPQITFGWFDLDGIGGVELRPGSHRAWLARHSAALAAGGAPPLEFHVEQS